MNIAGNAVKFTNNGTVSIYVLADKRDVSFIVEDTGIGMDSETLSRVFEDFFQGSNRERDPRKGFGLGLSVAKRLIEQLSGTIEVVSKPGVGSKFVVSVPKKPVASVLTFA
jgi:signal transduction histidine kinase